MILNEHINGLLQKMQPISLAEMESVKLMDRIDSKYMFHLNDLAKILTACTNDYSVAVINAKNHSTYETQYFDTADLQLYNLHHSGKLNRYKIRIRTYLESHLSFLEVKFKNNKGRTTKSRIKLEENVLSTSASDFIEKETPLTASSLRPSVLINYIRITLVNKHFPERITLDVNLTMSKDGRKHSFHDLVIAEVKQSKQINSKFVALMKEHRIKEGGISKYCLAISNLIPQIKNNNFKANNYRIKKLIHS